MGAASLLRRMRSRLTSPAEPSAIERAEWSFYIEYLRPGMTVFDVGANVGETTFLFARFARPGMVHAFEPGADAFRRLAAVTQAAELKNVIPSRVAVCDREGEAKLFVYDQEHMSWNTLADRPLENYGSDAKPVGEEMVAAVTLDEYCTRTQVNQIDLLKLDVEGAELQCLIGARQLLQRKAIRCCVFEFGATTFDMGNRPEDIQSLLSECGYRLENIIPSEPLFPGGGDGQSARFAIHVARPT